MKIYPSDHKFIGSTKDTDNCAARLNVVLIPYIKMSMQMVHLEDPRNVKCGIIIEVGKLNKYERFIRIQTDPESIYEKIDKNDCPTILHNYRLMTVWNNCKNYSTDREWIDDYDILQPDKEQVKNIFEVIYNLVTEDGTYNIERFNKNQFIVWEK